MFLLRPGRPTRLAWLLSLLLAVAIVLPFALLSFYNHPFMDDYFNAANAKKQGFLALQKDLYLNWSGRYFSSLLVVGLNPMRYDWYDGLRFTPLLVLLATLAVAYLGIRTLSPAGRPRAEAVTLTLAAVAAYLQFIPEPYSALYWLTGSLVYQVAGLCTLLAVLAGVRALQAGPPRRRWAWRAAAVLGTVGAAASNEMSFAHLLLGTSTMALLYWRRADARLQWLALLGLGAVAGGLTLVAPGNFARMAYEFADNPIRTSLLDGVINALPQAPGLARSFLNDIPWLPFLGVTFIWGLIVQNWQRTNGLPTTLRLPWYAGLLFLAVGLLGTFWLLQVAMGRGAPPRVFNGLWLFWLPAWLTVVWAAIAAAPTLRQVPVPAWFAPSELLLALIILGVEGRPTQAWQELTQSGSMYDRQMLAREALLRGAASWNTKELIVPPIKTIKPRHILITAWDLSASRDSYVNTETALFFGLESLRVDSTQFGEAHPEFRITW